jgi:uncharacterized phiE125 gp8 family phage protein
VAKFHEIHSTLKRVTDATTEPVSTEEAMLHCRCDAPEETLWMAAAITTARQYCEAYTKRQLITGTWSLYLDQFPCDEIQLRVNPVSSVTSVVYNDASGNSQTLSSTLYRKDIVSEPSRIVPAYGQSWPATRGQINDVCVTFVAGYGVASSVPRQFKHAILMLVAHWREHPEAVLQGSFVHTPNGVNSLLDSVSWSKVH